MGRGGERKNYRYRYDAASFLNLEIEFRGGGIASGVKGLAEQKLWRFFDHVRTQNDPMKEYLVEIGVAPERIAVWQLGTKPRSKTRDRGSEPRRLFNVSSSMPGQGLELLLRAMKILGERSPEIELSVVGVRSEEVSPELRGHDIQILGSVTHSQVEQMNPSHDIFVISRPVSSLTNIVAPRKLIEAMSFGIPILATDLQAFRWPAGPTGAAYVKAVLPEEFA